MLTEESNLTQTATSLTCYHCGQPCQEEVLRKDEKNFCCYGCQTVYDILQENDLCEYYDFEKNPGITQKKIDKDAFAYLDEETVRNQVVLFFSEKFAKVEFYVPAIHCISCLWLLENLQRLQAGVVRSQVNFARKRVTIEYDPSITSLRAIAATMDAVGYAPQINLEQKKSKKETHPLVAKLAVAGFCFGNTMLLSFPEYLGLDASEHYLQKLFSYLNIFLAIPVVLYSAQDYFKSTLTSLQQKQINIDVPIAIGLAALFLRSTYDVLFQIGPGYFDSLTGLVFFLLIGRWFQDKTYESLAFDRDYKSYFPLAIQKKMGEEWKPVVVYELEVKDVIRVRNLEVIPADSLLMSDLAYIDYSFVTGESKPVKVRSGELVYAGGRLLGEPVQLRVQKKTSQSHLTSLWNKAVFQKPKESKYKRMIDRVAKRFTWFVLVLAVATTAYWYVVNPAQVWLILTSVLIVACPCALALAAPFTYGSMMRAFGREGFYLKNADVLERMAAIDTLVFDKTGTLTQGAATAHFVGELSSLEQSYVRSLAAASTHPLSELLVKNISTTHSFPVKLVIERVGKGLEGIIEGVSIKIGSAAFVEANAPADQTASYVFVSINNQLRGYYVISTELRSGIRELVMRLKTTAIAMLSGDNESDRPRMHALFPEDVTLRFHQSPHDKMDYIQELGRNGRQVMMLGDGLNDAGALKLSEVGVAVSDNAGVFTPACDAIIQGKQLPKLDRFLSLAKSATTILKIGFVISFFYNIIALSFAVSGYLTPLIAAILMPISSISVVGFSSLAVRFVSRKI